MTRKADLLLDEQRINGVYAIRRHVSPQLDIVAVEPTVAALERAIGRLCQLWGGAKYLLIPGSSDGIPDPAWVAAIDRPSAHIFKSLDEPVTDPKKGDPLPSWTAEPLLGVVFADYEARSKAEDSPKPRISTRLPERGDPWYLAYLASLGCLPLEPDPEVLDRGGLVSSLRFEQMLDVERGPVAAPSATDLLAKVAEQHPSSPALATLWLLAPNPRPWRINLRGYLPDPHATALEAGPRVVVVHEPDSISDACLIWSLRAIYGEPPTFPLGAPITDGGWEARFAAELAGGGFPLVRSVVLTSCSVPSDRLDAIAARHEGWSVLPPMNLLGGALPASRPSQDVAVFANGVSASAVASGSDRELLRRLPRGTSRLTSTFELIDRRIPPIENLRREHGAAGLSDGGYQVDIRDVNAMNEIEWPSGWKVLEAAVAERGLTAVASPPGRAAMALLSRIGGVKGIDYFLSSTLLDEIHRICELRSMSWFRARIRELQGDLRGANDDVDSVARALGALGSRLVEDDRSGAPFDVFKKALGSRDAAEVWVTWAERMGILARGAQLTCARCDARQWRAVAEWGATIACRSCGEPMPQPFPPNQLNFAYRPSQPLLSAVEFDALPHLYPMRWFAELLNPWPDVRGEIYGMHPGIELRRDGKTIAEVDAVVLLSNGDLVPGEVKRSGLGLKQQDLDQLDRACDVLRSPWSFVATPDRASNCTEIWRTAANRGKDRFTLTGDHLLEQQVHWTINADPFAWRELSAAAWTERDRAFAANLRTREAWDRIERLPGRFDLPER